MPIYEYSCPQCGTGREVLHKLSETPEIPCERCEGQILRRQVSAAAFRLKGGGWYETDFKKDGKRNLAGETDPGSPAPSADESKSKPKTDAAPAASVEAKASSATPAAAPPATS